MNCKRCHHVNEAHESSAQSHSITRAGKCLIPNCPCPQFMDPIEEIDDDLI